MVKTDFSGNYVNLENTPHDSKAIIVSSGSYEDKKTANGKSWKAFTLNIDNGNKVLEYTVDDSTGLRFQKEWGTESNSWLGKTIQFKHEASTKDETKKVIRAYPFKE
jgi:hypothetical protein